MLTLRVGLFSMLRYIHLFNSEFQVSFVLFILLACRCGLLCCLLFKMSWESRLVLVFDCGLMLCGSGLFRVFFDC